ncbi:Insulin-induced gene 2 protein [Trichoplax sp. H2]|uniref:Insulin-induced gene 1 protein n=1 Tax=Trichoplax adhaerens TaxID=10228 RepID=B3RT72_TRIAD|nr:hypothetical protein TRIADDRAFT_63790 [Trichoplax adhaerens]EDV27174.1 hypothetical protein TRIADDRAFT_63790 [Trichoplax adhaerens]RDD45746.1 Insulin-induced gene 2 protein [Trichoplax sp. H2]|eukprot:XP_002111170.1 hypothetical protein TRIADDRAFT_63790 [Trichoplax adhaerens]
MTNVKSLRSALVPWLRIVIALFFIGVIFALVLNVLQVQRNVAAFSRDVLSGLALFGLSMSTWWMLPSYGTGAVLIGLAFPCADHHLGESPKIKNEWTSIMRCTALWIGINHAAATLNFSTPAQLTFWVSAMSLCLWWLYDRTRTGLFLAMLSAVVATGFNQILVSNGVFSYNEPDLLSVKSWLPSIYFSGGLTIGNIGRQLVVYEDLYKPHQD